MAAAAKPHPFVAYVLKRLATAGDSEAAAEAFGIEIVENETVAVGAFETSRVDDGTNPVRLFLYVHPDAREIEITRGLVSLAARLNGVEVSGDLGDDTAKRLAAGTLRKRIARLSAELAEIEPARKVRPR